MRINRPILALAIALLSSVWGMGISAQNVVSPYSKYGYGLLSDHATSSQRALGGVGYAMNSGRQINVMNPASYAAMDSLTFLFDMGVDASMLWTREGSKFGRDFTGGLNYITMQVPVTKWLGASLGLLPYSSVGYQFGGTIENGASERIGSGGLNQVYIGAGAKILPGLSLGANFSYLWGNVVNASYVYTSTGATSLFEHTVEVRDWMLDLGVQYTLRLSRKNSLTFGATFSPGKNLTGHTYGIEYRMSSSALYPDTTSHSRLGKDFSIPDTWGFGVAYKWNDRLLAEADFTYQNWKKAKFTAPEGWEKSTFDNRYKIAAGLQYEPNPRGTYLQRVQYRMGAYATHDYLVVKGNNVREFGVTAGLGLPIPMFKTMINIGFEYKHRQAHPTPLLKEQYFNITLGVNFNEMWFWRNKIR